MVKRSLIETNPYLRDSIRRLEMFPLTVYTSTDIECATLTQAELEERKAI